MKLNERESSEYIVISCVPQGSHLGPTLFLIFINDIVKQLGLEMFICLYADDLRIAVAVESEADAEKLQTAIDRLREWCDTNYLHLYLYKCSVLTISKKIHNEYH